jgi:hypothetical protein
MFATKSAVHEHNQRAIKKETTGLLRATAILLYFDYKNYR